jgi:hypothetical protein
MQKAISGVAGGCLFAVIVLGLPWAFGGEVCDGKAIGGCIRDWVKDVAIPVAAFSAALFAVRFTFRQMIASEKQLSLLLEANLSTRASAEAAVETVKLMRREQRPWIIVDIDDVGLQRGVYNDQRGWAISGRMKFRNIGKNPALWVYSSLDSTEHIADLVASHRRNPLKFGAIIFPDQSFTEGGRNEVFVPWPEDQPFEGSIPIGGFASYHSEPEGPPHFTPARFEVVIANLNGEPTVASWSSALTIEPDFNKSPVKRANELPD